jgi:hypothetical protein
LQSNFFDLFNTSDLHRFSSAEPCIVARFFDVLAKPWKLHFSDMGMSSSAGAQF